MQFFMQSLEQGFSTDKVWVLFVGNNESFRSKLWRLRCSQEIEIATDALLVMARWGVPSTWSYI